MDEWKEEYGGSLQLFSTDCYGYPDTIVESVVPKFNTLVLFEVTHTSFHQVQKHLFLLKVLTFFCKLNFIIIKAGV